MFQLGHAKVWTETTDEPVPVKALPNLVSATTGVIFYILKGIEHTPRDCAIAPKLFEAMKSNNKALEQHLRKYLGQTIFSAKTDLPKPNHRPQTWNGQGPNKN